MKKIKHYYKIVVNYFNNLVNSVDKYFKSLINKILLKYKNKIKSLSYKSKSKISNFNKILITFISLLFVYLFYLSIPTLYNKSWVQNTLEYKLVDQFKIDFSISSDISYEILPSPHFKVKNSMNCKNGHKWEQAIANRTKNYPNKKGECKVCRSLGFNRPDLIKEWDFDKNKLLGLDPYQITLSSDIKVGWVCAKGHKWEGSAYSRTRVDYNKKNIGGCKTCNSEI